MTEKMRIEQLLEEILDSNRTPEEVCAGETQLLPEVQRKWRLLRCVGSELDELFPCNIGIADMTSASPADERDWLFGAIAFQMGFVARDDLLSALRARISASDRTLARLLVDHEALTSHQSYLLDELVDEHIKAHGGDVRCSLDAVPRPAFLEGALQNAGDTPAPAVFANAQRDPDAKNETSVDSGVRYRVLRQHARGGVGVVSVAHDDELGREVALKEIDATLASDRIVRMRFVREAEITGGLEHPGIVPVYGLGRYPDGRPYYAMRFIRGVSLQEALTQLHRGDASYTLRGLLTRFAAVCNAVAYAHSRGVVHRDIKPANVMLGSYGETLVVDWGLAKVIGSDTPEEGSVSEATLRTPMGHFSPTHAGSAFGTPEYMSPEQARGETKALGTATDIYSLGATLYAVLAGQAPVQGQTMSDLLENVRMGNWPSPRRVNRAVPEALDAVCRKAMALNPEDRYGSAQELAADVERWLADQPVRAYSEPAYLKAGRWIRHHGRLVTGAIALLMAIVPLSLIIAVNREEARQQAGRQRDEIRAQKELAETNEKTALERQAATQAVLDFVETRILAAARPQGQDGGLGWEVTLRDAVESALPYVGDSFQKQPLLEARLRTTLGLSFAYLGEANIALEQNQRASALYAACLGPDDPDTLRSMTAVANALAALGRYGPALELRQRTLTLLKSKLGPDDPDTLTGMNDLAESYRLLTRFSDALELHEQTLALRKAKLGPDHPDTLTSMSNLADTLRALERGTEALELHQRTLALRKAKLGPDHPDTLKSMDNLSRCYSLLGQKDAALQLRKDAFALQKAKLGPSHPATLIIMNSLATSYYSFGRYADALALFEQTLALRRAKLGSDHPETFVSINNIATTYAALGRHADALRLLEALLPQEQARLGPDHFHTLVCMYNIACNQAQLVPESANPKEQADLAMSSLRAAVKAGFDCRKMLRTDKDLAPLRGRDDFLKLVAEVECKADKEKK
jgi:eukaryotic-like serine/threonine-protein kinase